MGWGRVYPPEVRKYMGFISKLCDRACRYSDYSVRLDRLNVYKHKPREDEDPKYRILLTIEYTFPEKVPFYYEEDPWAIKKVLRRIEQRAAASNAPWGYATAMREAVDEVIKEEYPDAYNAKRETPD